MVRFKTSQGVVLPMDVPFELNDLSYPSNWLRLASAEDLKRHDIVAEEAETDASK